jgi:Phasin protein
VGFDWYLNGKEMPMAPQDTAGRETSAIPAFDPEVLSEISKPALAAATAFQHRTLESMTAYQKEWFGFLNARWQENMAMPARLSACRSLPEVQQVYMDYWKRAADQYGREYQSLGMIARADNAAASAAPPTSGNPARTGPMAASRSEAAGARAH